jgi:hypothetical protein
MCPSIEVKFVRLSRDPSVEAAIQRWVDRLDWNMEIADAQIAVERSGWRRVSVHVSLFFGAGRELSLSTSHTDIYVAVADAFREARKRMLGGALAPAAKSPAIRMLAVSV